MKRVLSSLVVIVAALLWSSAAHAQTVLDPDTLHIGDGFSGSCPLGCAGDPNTISGTELSIYQTQDSPAVLSDPLILIIGIPCFSSGGCSPTAPTLGTVTYYANDTGPGTNVTGNALLAGGINGSDDVFTQSDGGDAYAQIGRAHV